MLEKFGIEGIYVVHAKNGYEEHEAWMNKILKERNLNFEFVSDGDPSTFDSGILDKYFTPDIRTRLTKGALSLTLNHLLAYERIVKNNNRYALVFEDDLFFLGDFNKQIEKIVAEADTLPPGFIISLENTTLKFPSTKKLKKGKLLYEESYGRCAGACLIDLQGAKNMLNSLNVAKCGQIIDWWHNTLIEKKVIKMYWADPPITEQGSHNGLMSAGVSSRKKSLPRRISWLGQKYIKSYVTRWFK